MTNLTRKTIGQQLADTQSLHEKQQIEVGEFVDEVGQKEIMPAIWDNINRRKDLPQWQDKFYILNWFRKSAVLHRVLENNIQCRHTRPRPEWGLTLYSYDPKTNKLELEWTLPNKSAVPMFLKNRDYTDSNLIRYIEMHLAGVLN